MSVPNVTAERYWCPHCKSVFRSSFARCPLDGAVLEVLQGDPLVGTVLGDRYVIEECVGEGGMGRIYKARHRHMSRRFAIKMLFGDLAADKKMRNRFSQEAEAACRLSHPNVVSVNDVGETPVGQLYLAMDFVDGPDLRALIREQAPFDTRRAADLLWQLASGLSHAHDKGLVHRDFKPGNIIVIDEGKGEVPKILDFGIAHILEDGHDNQLTTEGTVMGTPAYMSPEHAMGEPLDGRTDLFSLGVVLYQMLCGRLPFDGKGPELVRKNMSVEPPAIAHRVPGVVVDPTLETIAFQLMAKRPEHRFQQASEVIQTLVEAGLVGADSQHGVAPRRTLMHASQPVPDAAGRGTKPLLPRAGTTPPHTRAGTVPPHTRPGTVPPHTRPGTMPPQPRPGTMPPYDPYATPNPDGSGHWQANAWSGAPAHDPAAGGSSRPRRGLVFGLILALVAMAGALTFLVIRDRSGQRVAQAVADAGTPDAGMPDAGIADAGAPAPDAVVATRTPDAGRKKSTHNGTRKKPITVEALEKRFNQVTRLSSQLVDKLPNNRTAQKIQDEVLEMDYVTAANNPAKRRVMYKRLGQLRARIRRLLPRD